jgi:hypothetical protein
VDSGLTHFRLVHAERDLLENTLSGAVKMLTEVVGLANPAAYSRAARVHRYALAIAESLGVGDHWELRLAAMLSQIGCITLPPEVITKVYSDQTLEGEERRLYDTHAEVTAKLLGSIPRLEGVAEIIAGQMRRPDLTSASQVASHWDSIRLGTLVLRAATELDQLIARGMRASVALQKLTESWPELPAAIADALRTTQVAVGETIIRAIVLADLSPGMVLDEDLRSSNGIRLVPQGHEVTNTIMVRLRSVAAGVGVKEPFRVRVQT